MLSKADIKYIKSLQVKKYRKEEQCFIVEGAKSVQELLHSDFQTEMIVATSDFLSTINAGDNCRLEAVSVNQLNGLGEFQTNDTALAVVRMKPNVPVKFTQDEYVLMLDDIRDPGNLGTIIRTADWFGIFKIIASPETADFYNSKVISATMGSFTRTQIFYTDLPAVLKSISGQPVYGAFLEGDNIHQVKFGDGGLVVIGNESRGISASVAEHISKKITIPRIGHAESLNAAIATAVILDNLRRSS